MYTDMWAKGRRCDRDQRGEIKERLVPRAVDIGQEEQEQEQEEEEDEEEKAGRGRSEMKQRRTEASWK